MIRFTEIAGFPGIIGAVDGTHIAIVAPSNQNEQYKEYTYVNRKGFHSLNVQLVRRNFTLNAFTNENYNYTEKYK